jgi:uncharacterized protein (DUF2249 family)/hemerythrin-like domain-containing protein
MTTTTTALPHTLDLSDQGCGERRARLLSAFDALRTGETLVLVTADDPRFCLENLQATRGGLFEWSPLAADPTHWHVEITRRDAAWGQRRRVTEALRWDHERLHRLEERAFAALLAGDRKKARSLYAAFHHGLNRHIRFEEELLFPVFEVKAGLPHGGPTAVMRAEHREIRMLLEELVRAVDDGPTEVEEQRQALHGILREHDRKEESILYPGTDEMLTEAESDALVAKIQAFPW